MFWGIFGQAWPRWPALGHRLQRLPRPAVGVGDDARWEARKLCTSRIPGQQEGGPRGRQFGREKALGHVEQQGWGLGQHALLSRHQGNGTRPWDGWAIFGVRCSPAARSEALDPVWGAGFHQGRTDGTAGGAR